MHVTAQLAAAIAVWGACHACIAQGWTLSRVADTNTPVPGEAGTFGGTPNRPFEVPSLNEVSRVSFWARYNQGIGNGIFSNAGGALETIATLNTIIPGSAQPFATLSPHTDCDLGIPTFSGQNQNGTLGGVYARQNGQLVTIVDANTPLPGGGGAFGLTGLHSRDGQRTVFGASSGLYQSHEGVISRIGGIGTAAPGGGAFTYVGRGLVSGASVVFDGGVGSRMGLFAADLSGPPTFSVIADTTTQIPNGTGTFRLLGSPSISGENIAFIGNDQDLRTGIYARINGQLLNIADTIHPGPGGIQFTGFDRVAISGDSIAFVAGMTTAPFGGLFVLRNGELSRVVAVGDTLNGLVVSGIHFGPEGLKGDTIAFSFSEVIVGPFPLKGGVYTATYIPGPGVMGIGAAAAFAAASRRYR